MAAVAIFGARWDRRRRRLGYSFVLVFSFREPRLGALQDLYEDWSAIYRNRIPPYLTLPLAQSPQPPLYLTDHSAPLFLILLPFSLPLLRASPRRFYSVFHSATSSLPSPSPGHLLSLYSPYLSLSSLCP